MKKNCDLHTHSYFSDGTLSPTEIVELAEEKELAAVVLCDHNTVDGLDEFLKAGEDKKVLTVPAVEFSTDYGEIELHIIGMFIGREDYDKVSDLMEAVQLEKEKSNIDLIYRLAEAGFDISYEDIKGKTHTGKINRAHVAAELTAKGYTDSVSDAFEKLLNQSVGYYVPPKRPNSFEMIKFIKEIGGLAILAHPFLNLKTEESLRTFLIEAKKCGLDGMEVTYPRFSEEQANLANKLAEEFDLLKSGGSDFHGSNKPDIYIGVGKNNISVPVEFYLNIKEKYESNLK